MRCSSRTIRPVKTLSSPASAWLAAPLIVALATLGVVVIVFYGAGLRHANSITSYAVLGRSGGCPSIQAIGNFLPSSVVGASLVINTVSNTTTYYFDSTDRKPVNGVPGLIQYCVYPTQPPGNPDSAVAIAVGDVGSIFKVVFGSIQGFFAFRRDSGNPSNLPLNGSIWITVGNATWKASAPQNQTILLHINDPLECGALYGGNNSETCFVHPAFAGPPPLSLCNGLPACKEVIIDEAIISSPLIVPARTLLHANFTYIIVNQPTNTYSMIFYPPVPSTKDINSGGAKDYFGCEWIPDPIGSPDIPGKLNDYQDTGFTMRFFLTGGSCDQSRFTLTAPSGPAMILAPGEFKTFTINMVTRVNKGGKQEYTSVGQHFLNSGFTLKWFQSDDELIHSFSTNLVTVNLTG